jgi:hypothetical protein
MIVEKKPEEAFGVPSRPISRRKKSLTTKSKSRGQEASPEKIADP